MQLDIFSIDRPNVNKTVRMEWLDPKILKPHPKNPRRGNPQKLEAYIESMREEGYRPDKPMLVRPFEDSYQIVGGHSRQQAAIAAGLDKVWCCIEEMDDEESILRLAQDNLNDPFPWYSQAIYVVENTVKDSKKGLSRTALVKAATGKEDNAAAKEGERLSGCGTVLLFLEQSVIDDRLLPSLYDPEQKKTLHLAAIHKAPEQYWQQLTELLIEKEWSVKETEAIVSNIREINIPDRYHHWLNPEKAIKETIAESLKGETSRTPRDLKNWIAAADECLELLPDSRKVTLVRNAKEAIEYWNLQETFLSRLPDLCAGAKKPSAQRIKDLAQSLLSEVKELDDRHASWLASKASEEERKKRDEEERLKQLQMQSAYSPKGFNADIEDFLKDCTPETYNAIITDVPYCVSNGGFTLRSGKESVVDKNFEDSITPDRYVPQFFEILKPGGTFLTTCTHHILPELINVAIESGFEFRQQLIWFRPGSPPLLSADRFQPDYENILVFVKPGPHYFGYNDIKLDDKQRGAVIQMPQCSGQERQYNHDTQKPEALYEILIKAYCPKDGTVLEPFGGSGTTPAVCKRLQRICHWVEKSPEFFAVASDRIEATPFHWEV